MSRAVTESRALTVVGSGPLVRCWASRRARGGVLGALALLSVLLYAASRSDILPSADDSIYLITAKALAQGEGYRHSGITGLPPARQYPVVYPAVLAVLWRLFPQYPANLGAMQLVSGVAGALAIPVAYAYLVRSGLAPPGLALLAALMAAVNPIWVWLAGIVWSEMLYTLLSFVALYAVTRWEEDGGGALDARPAGWAAVALVGVALAPLTRYLGAALVAGVAFYLARRKAWGKTIAVLAVSAASFAPWWLWVRASGGSTYASNVATGTAALTTASTNWVDTLVYAVPYHVIPLLPYYAVSRIEQAAGGLGAAVLTGMRLVVLALVLVGFTRTWRDRPQPVHGYVLVYLLLLGAYGLDAYRAYMHRYLTPVAPLLLVWFFLGLHWAAQSVGTRLSATPPKGGVPGSRLSKWATVVVAGLSLVGSAQRDSVMLYNALTTGNAHGVQDARREQRCREAAAWIRTEIPQAARVASDWAPYLHLVTGRTVATVTPLGAEPTTPDKVWKAIRAQRPDYLVAFGQPDLGAAVRAHPDVLEPVMQNGCAAVYRTALQAGQEQG